MATITPFQAIHPRYSIAHEVAALPYDVYNRSEARIAVEGKPLSFLNIDRPETQFPPQQNIYDSAVYQKAADMLRSRIEEGVFVKDAVPAYYLYELTMQGRAQTGIVACASIDDYLNGVIRKHENTRAEKEEDRIHHVDACNAQTGPIFLAYRHNDTLCNLIAGIKKEKAPDFDFVSEDGIRHRGWTVAQAEAISVISETFEGIKEIYIADGHHRCASAVKVGLKRRAEHPDGDGSEEYNRFLSVLFPDDELMIMDYNRVVLDLNNLTPEAFLQKIEEKCTIRPSKAPVRPARKGEVGMYLSGRWYSLCFRPEYCSSDPVEGLDVSCLQREILTPVLGISDPRTDPRIDFVGGIRGLAELERRVDSGAAAAFSMYPTSIRELFDVADAGRLMPPKSTWFEPKLRSGLYIHDIS